MGLDINTPKGQKSLEYERLMVEKINNAWQDRQVSFIETHKGFDSVCDGFLVKMNTVIALHESKCRDLTFDKLQQFGTWLITAEKIEKCQTISQYLKIPFLGFLYLIPEDRVLMWKITDEKGRYLFEFEKAITETKRTINGGTTSRMNAFLPVKYAAEIK